MEENKLKDSFLCFLSIPKKKKTNSLGPIGASIVAMSPRTMLDLNPALAMGKPTFESRGPPITSKDFKDTDKHTTDAGKKNYL